MNKVKTAIIIVVLLLLISVAFFFFPANSFIETLPLINQFSKNSEIIVTSGKGKAEVFIGDKSYGFTPVTISNLKAGSYSVDMVRISDNTDMYNRHTFPIELPRNTEAIINMEIGPDSLLSGYVLYYVKTPSKQDKGYININSSPEKASIYIDDEFYSLSPINTIQLKHDDYKIKILAEGYEEISFPVIVRAGYNLNVQTYLFPIPIDIITKQNE